MKVAALLKTLPVEVIDLIEKKVEVLIKHREHVEKHDRMSKSNTMTVEEMDSVDGGSLKGDDNNNNNNNNDNVAAATNAATEELFGSSAEADPEDWRAQLRDANKAALKIQSVGRGKAARKVKSNIFTAQDNKRANQLLLEDDMLEFSGEITRNIMFNLALEASYGEFAFNAKPLKFMIKK